MKPTLLFKLARLNHVILHHDRIGLCSTFSRLAPRCWTGDGSYAPTDFISCYPHVDELLEYPINYVRFPEAIDMFKGNCLETF
jgi:hypothetical protein